MNKKDLGIVICNFNKKEYLEGCLRTLFQSILNDISYDVIVVDNASTDGSAEFVKKNYPHVVLLENEINTGGSGGFDRGIQYILKNEYTYVALLDNDILLEENTLINLIDYIQNNPQVGVVGSKICTMDNPNILQEMGSFIDYENKFNVSTPLKSHKDDESLPEVVICDYVPACCMITTNDVLKKVGSFNTGHFIYWDDMDWCTRVKKAGWEIHAINHSRVFHKMGAANHTNTFGVYYFERNRIMFFLKYLEDAQFEKFSNAICNWLLPMIFFSNLKGNYATPKSFLCAIDDLLLGNLGKQDESIFIKEPELNIFNKYNLKSSDHICIYLQHNMISNRKTYLYLKNYYAHINIYCEPQNFDLIQSNFDERVISYEDFMTTNFKTIFAIEEHVLDFIDNEIYKKNYIFMDQFINVISYDEIKSLKTSYTMFEDIFRNIYQPLIKKKFLIIKKLFTKKAQ